MVAGTVRVRVDPGSDERTHPVVWRSNGVADINTSLTGTSVANNHGVVLVQSEPDAAVVWDTKRMMLTTLPGLGAQRPTVSDINDRGSSSAQ